MIYQPEFLHRAEEEQLLDILGAMPLVAMRYRQYTARREVLSFGASYDFAEGRLEAAEPLAQPLHPLRERVAAWMGIDPGALSHVLVARYRPGTPLGWHRDVPDFEDVVGVSLGAEALMRFRPYPAGLARRPEILHVPLAERSIYLLRGAARWRWQHSVAPVQALRYSITFRTVRAARGAAASRGTFTLPAAGP